MIRSLGYAEIAVAVAAVLCYANVLPNDFCDDGVPIVAENERVNAPGQWAAIWTTDYWEQAKDATPYRDLLYRPVSLTSYRLVRVIAGVHPLPHHVVNILLHALVSVLIIRLSRRLGGSEPAALSAGLLFAVLPIHTAVLNNVVGRADLLAASGVIAALLCHRKIVAAGSGGARFGWCAAAGAAAFVAMGSKESGASVILLVPLFDLLWHHMTQPAKGQARWLSLGTAHRLSYLILPAAVYFALRYHALEGHLYQRPALSKTINVLVDAPLWQHVLGVLQSWGMYWEKTFWPSVLCVNYSVNEIRLATGVFEWHVILGVVVTVVLAAASVIAWRRGVRSVAFLSLALVIAHAPTANVLALIQVFFAERIWYLPSVWLAILVGLAVAPLVRRPVWWAVGGLILFGMTARCWIRNTEWHDNGTLYAAAYRDHPDAIGARFQFGQWLALHTDDPDNIARGIALLRRAIDIDLGSTDGHRALGQAYLRVGDLEAALEHLRIADMQIPGHPTTVESLRLTSEALSDRDRELVGLMSKTDQAPHDVEAQIALVRKLRELGRARESLERLQAHDDKFRRNPAWCTEFAVTLVYLNERDAAIERYRLCRELDPRNPQLTIELAMLLIERREGNDLDEAWRLCDHAAGSAPDLPLVMVCRAELLALRGDLARAVNLYERAIRALPEESEQRRAWEARARTLGR